MSEFKAAGFSDEFGGGPDLIGITTMTSPYYFVPPSGSTAERPQSAPPGMLRFNTDIGRLEVWRNDHWATILGESPNLGKANSSGGNSGGTGTRAIAFGGNNGSPFDDIEYFTIETLGNAQDFDDMVRGTGTAGQACASRTRAVYAGGQVAGAPSSDEMEFVTIASTGSATDWGANLRDGRDFLSALSNQTRGMWVGGRTSGGSTATNLIDYITIASSGVISEDFGDLRTAALWYPMSLASSVRGVIGQSNGSASPTNIDYISISTLGNAQDFGTLSDNFGGVGASNATRGIFGGGYNPSLCNSITFVTIATTGNSQDFGDLSETNRSAGAATNPTRAVFVGGKIPATVNTLEYITLPTTGNAIDFGNLAGSNSGIKGNVGACSNGHGGL